MRRHVVRRDRGPDTRFDRTYTWHGRMAAPVDCEVAGHRPEHVALTTIRGGFVRCGRCFRQPLRPVVKDYGYDRGTATLAMFDSLDAYARYVNADKPVAWSGRDADLAVTLTRHATEFTAGAAVGYGPPFMLWLTVPGVGALHVGTTWVGHRPAHRRPAAAEPVVVGVRADLRSLAWEAAGRHGTVVWRHLWNRARRRGPRGVAA